MSSGDTTFPRLFDILAPSLITMPWVNRRSAGSLVLDQSHVAHELGPEARVDQMQNRVLHAADVLIDVDLQTSSQPACCQTALCRCARRCSDRNTRTNRRTCPWYRSRGGRDLHTSGRSYSQTPATRPSGDPPVKVMSTCSGRMTGRSFSGTGTMPSFSQ